MIRWSWDCLTFITGIPILVRWHLVLGWAPFLFLIKHLQLTPHNLSMRVKYEMHWTKHYWVLGHFGPNEVKPGQALHETMKWLCETCSHLSSGRWFDIKMSSYLYRKFHCGDCKTILRPSCLNNGISYTGKTTSLYWIGALSSFQHGQIHSSLRPGDAYMHQ